MNRLKYILASLVLVSLLLSANDVSAHSIFKKHLETKFLGKKFTCNLCHVAGQKKEVKNSYGQLFIKVMNKPKLTADWKAKKGDQRKAYQKDVMIPAFDAAFTKISKMTFADLVNYNMIEGVKGPEPAEPWKPAGSDQKAMDSKGSDKKAGADKKAGSDKKEGSAKKN